MSKLKDDFRKQKLKQAGRATAGAKETRALEKIINTLDTLDPKGQQRVLRQAAQMAGPAKKKQDTRYPGH